MHSMKPLSPSSVLTNEETVNFRVNPGTRLRWTTETSVTLDNKICDPQDFWSWLEVRAYTIYGEMTPDRWGSWIKWSQKFGL